MSIPQFWGERTALYYLKELKAWLISSRLIHNLDSGNSVLEDQYLALHGQEENLIRVERDNSSSDRLASREQTNHDFLAFEFRNKLRQ